MTKQISPVRAWVAVLACCSLAMAGCVGRPLTEIADKPLATTALATIQGTPPAAIFAVGGTQQLGAIGVTYDGAAVTTFDSLVYQLATRADSLRVKLAPTGIATGLTSSGASAVLVNVFAFKAGALKGDQVVLQVTPTIVPGLVLSVQPVAPDSAKLAAGVTKTITPVLRNPVTGLSVVSPAVRYTIKGSDSTRVDVYRGTVRYFMFYNQFNTTEQIIVRPATSTSLATNQISALNGEGSAWLYATINAYGTVLQDSVQYTFSYPYTQTISTVKVNLAVQSLYAFTTVTLAPGATVTFQNGVATTDPLTVAYTFDNPAAMTAATPASTTGGATGNVSTLTGGQTSNRKFLTPGTYHWTAIPAGGPAPWPGQILTGTIVIK